MSWTSSKLETPDGASLQIYCNVPNRKLKGIVQINHGMSEHAARYERVSKVLARNGYAVYVHDHRGHGQTTAPGSSLGVLARRDGWY